MGVALLDSNAVVGFPDGDDLLHRAADQALREIATEHVFAVSVVTPDALILATADLNADVLLTGEERCFKASGLGCELRLITSGV